MLILSTHYIYLLSSKEIKKKVSIHETKYIVKSTLATGKEIVIYFREGFDFRLSFDSIDDFMNMLKLRFASLSPVTTLKIYGVPNNHLKDFVAPAKKNNYVFDAAPEEKYRLLNEEIPGSGDKEAHQSMISQGSKHKTSHVEQDPNDFEFENRGEMFVDIKQHQGDEEL